MKMGSNMTELFFSESVQSIHISLHVMVRAAHVPKI